MGAKRARPVRPYDRQGFDQGPGPGSLLLTLLVVGALVAVAVWYWSPALPLASRLLVNPFAPGDNAAEVSDGSATATAAGGLESSPAVTATAGLPAPAADASGPRCPPGEQPRFVLGFARLKTGLGKTMGDALSCEYVNPENGDTLQQTTAGLAVYRPSTGTLMFTDGWQKWALTARGLVTWEGEAMEPPPDARVVTP